MPLALALIAAMMFIVAVRGNYADAGALYQETFFGAGGKSGFLLWFGSILGIAIIFRLIQAPRAGEMFIILLLLVYFLEHQNVLSAIEQALQQASQSAGQTDNAASGASPAANASGSK